MNGSFENGLELDVPGDWNSQDPRLVFYQGVVWYEHEFDGYGYPFPKPADRIRMLGGTVEIVTRMWSEPDVDFQGRHYTLKGAQCDPKPIQQPRPQVLIGGGHARPGPSTIFESTSLGPKNSPLSIACRSSMCSGRADMTWTVATPLAT